MDNANIKNINLTTPEINVDKNDDTNIVCEPNYRCNTGDLYNYQLDATYGDCPSAFDPELDVYNCRKYHIITNCIQNCSFVNENNVEKTLDNDGFQKIPRLVDVSYRVTDSMEIDEESMEPNFKTFYNHYQNPPDPELYSDNGFLYAEYLFKMFIEKNNPTSNLHKLSDGIYFINGKIIICRFSRSHLRLSNIKTTKYLDLPIEQQNAVTTLQWTESEPSKYPGTWDRIYDNDSLFVQKPNWGDLTQEQQEAAITLDWTPETWGKDIPYSKFYVGSGNPFPMLHMDFQKYITYDSIDNKYGNAESSRYLDFDGKTSKYHYIRKAYNNGIQFDSNENSKSINLWLLLQGSDGVKTMGFIDIIDDDDSNKYNADTLRDMQGNDLAIQKDDSDEYSMVSFPGRLTPYFQVNNVQYPNVLEIQTSDNTLDPTKPDINPNILYTYDMIPGDVLAFRTDIPHIGFKDVRTSVEYRYDYVKIDIQVSEYIDFSENSCAGGRLESDINDKIIIAELLRYGIQESLFTDIITKIYIFFNLIYKTLIKNGEQLKPDQFFKFLEFLNSKLTLNLQKENNKNYDGNIEILKTYIQEFLKTL